MARARIHDATETPETPDDNTFAPARGAAVPRGAPRLSADFERIVERIYRVDALADYDKLEKALKLGEERASRGAVNKAMDEAEDNARLAHAMYLNAVLERMRWEADAEIIMAPIRAEASAELQREKDEKTRNKAITDADVTAKMAALHPDEFKWHLTHAAKVKGTEDHCKRLADIHMSRCASVRAMLDKSR